MPLTKERAKIKLINLTGKEICCGAMAIPPVGKLGAKEVVTKHGNLNGLPLIHKAYETSLPQEENATYLIVAPEIRRAYPDRLDLVSPGLPEETFTTIVCQYLESN